MPPSQQSVAGGFGLGIVDLKPNPSPTSPLVRHLAEDVEGARIPVHDGAVHTVAIGEPEDLRLRA